MNETIPIFTTTSIESAGAAIDKTMPASKNSSEITAQVASQYASSGNAAQPEELTPTGRKKRKYGPRKSVGSGAAQGEAGSVPVPGQDAGYTIDKAIVEKTAKAILNTVDGILVRKVGNTAIALGSDVALAKELAQTSGLTVPEADLMAELTGVIFEKHGLLTGYAPELLLGILVTEWGTRVFLVMKRLNVMEAEAKKRAKKNDDVLTPQANQDGHNR